MPGGLRLPPKHRHGIESKPGPHLEFRGLFILSFQAPGFQPVDRFRQLRRLCHELGKRKPSSPERERLVCCKRTQSAGPLPVKRLQENILNTDLYIPCHFEDANCCMAEDFIKIPLFIRFSTIVERRPSEGKKQGFGIFKF